MDIWALKDEIAKLRVAHQDRQMLGIPWDHTDWQKTEDLRQKVAAMPELRGFWNDTMLAMAAPPQMMIEESADGYQDDEEPNLNHFQPFKDSIETAVGLNEDGDKGDTDSRMLGMDNTRLFAHNAQMLESHDTHLESLYSSAKTQKHIATTINDHLTEEAILLGDLENQLGSTHGHLGIAQERLDRYGMASRQSSFLWREWLIILGLLVLLMLLLKL